jgi:hypothetical protein
MKMPQNIIAKFNLIETNEQFGQSVKNGLKVYKSTRPGLQHLRFAECDIQGKETDYISIMNMNEKKVIQVTPEFMGDIAFEAMINEAL